MGVGHGLVQRAPSEAAVQIGTDSRSSSQCATRSLGRSRLAYHVIHRAKTRLNRTGERSITLKTPRLRQQSKIADSVRVAAQSSNGRNSNNGRDDSKGDCRWMPSTIGN